MSDDEDLLRSAYAPERFRRDGAAVLEALATHLAAALAGEGPVHPAVPPREMAERWPARFPELPEEDVDSLVASVAAGSLVQHHPRFTGHQVTAPLPHAALFGRQLGSAAHGTAGTWRAVGVTRSAAARSGFIGWHGGLYRGGRGRRLLRLRSGRRR